MVIDTLRKNNKAEIWRQNVSENNLPNPVIPESGGIKSNFKKRLLATNIGKKICLQLKKRKHSLFQSVEIETTSICNRTCTYCPNSTHKRKSGYMEENLFYKIVDELAAIKFKGRFSPHFYGEPLYDTRIVQLLAYTRKKLPNVLIKLFTNGDLLTYDSFKELIEAGVDVFRISQHDEAPSKNILDIYKRLDSDTINRRIEFLKYFDNEELLMNRGGLIEVKKNVEMLFCFFAEGITIDYEGNMLLCCQDYMSKNIFGNLKTEKIVDIWNKDHYKILRDQIICGIWPVDICKSCTG